MIEAYERENVTCIEGTIERSGRNNGKIYCFMTDGLLIDTSAPCLESELIPFYENNVFDQVVLTHSHEDHTGTAAWIQANQEVPIHVHEKGIRTCEEGCNYPKYRQMAWGIRQPFRPSPLGATISSRNHEWKVIYTPGHANDHISLLDEETGRLFTGDLYVSPKTKVIMNTESIPVIMDSIRTLLRFDFGPIYCCHAGYIENGKEMLQKKLMYLEDLSEEVKSLHRQGQSAMEIKEKLFPKTYPIIGISEGEWDSLHIITSIISGFTAENDPKRGREGETI
ncbi:MBL fold metallo-hydrolase [Virgibacillus xinjiangensis]|uniref:MBL fold metallo-hydrolase n=1 Tax=Virgibacillus xinjiangensis TaxID=393090 RepID=A0ABV7CWK4_9BACI